MPRYCGNLSGVLVIESIQSYVPALYYATFVHSNGLSSINVFGLEILYGNDLQNSDV